MVLLGLALVAGGVWLTALGGSWYYVLVGIGFLLTGALLMARRAAALWVYAVVVFGTLVWAVLEVGFDWWQLAPRGGVIVLLGLWLLMPWVTNGLNRGAGARPPAVWRGAGVPLALSLMLAAGSAIWAFLTPSNDLAGRLPTQESATLPADYGGMPAGDWRAYGRTPYGDRYAPLDQITTENVDRLEAAWTYHTGDTRRPSDPEETTYELTPLKVGDTLYLCTPHN
jgi:quinoprotein glucose dehydrogenase